MIDKDLSKVYAKFIRPGFQYLPEKMNTPEAIAMMTAIGLQESRFEYRKQIGGPARGFWQFEEGGGVAGVMRHHSSKRYAENILQELEIKKKDAYDAIAYNDTVAAAFARLLLYTDPNQLPKLSDSPQISWEYYIRNWRPGKPHRETWDAIWTHATRRK